MTLDLALVYSAADLDVNLSPCFVECTYTTVDGTLMAGTVTFTPAPSFIADPNTKTIIVGTSVTATLVDGYFGIELISTDDMDMNPSGWTYGVVETLTPQGTSGLNFQPFINRYSIDAPGGFIINLADVIPVPTYTGTPMVRGRAGPTGPPGAGASMTVVDL